MLTDPAVWGPILVAVAVIWSGNSVMKIIHAANMDRRDDHRKVMEVLDSFPDELDQLKMHLSSIEQNTQPENDHLA